MNNIKSAPLPGFMQFQRPARKQGRLASKVAAAQGDNTSRLKEDVEMKRDPAVEETSNTGIATCVRAFGNRQPEPSLLDSSSPGASGGEPAQP